MKKIIAFFITVFFFITVQSQNPQWKWAARAGSIDYESGKCITADSDGNIYVIGDFNGQTLIFGTDTLFNSFFTNEIFIAKFDSSGNAIWAKNIEGIGNEYARKIAITSVGNILITGYFDGDTIRIGSSELINSTAGWRDMFIAMLDSAGNTIWAFSAGGYSSDYPWGVTLDSDDNIYMTGGFDSPSIALGNIVLNNLSSGYSDGFIVKINPAGNPLWAKRFGSSSSDYGFGVCADAMSNVFLMGGYESDSILFDSLILYNQGGNDVFVVKYDSTGTILSAKNFGGGAYEYPNSICIDASGSLYLTGGYNSGTITFGSSVVNSSPGLADVYIIKYDSALNEKWILAEGGPNYDLAFDIVCDAAGNLYACGHFNDTITFGNTTLISALGADPFMVHCDSAGNVIWAVSARGGDHADAAYGVAIHNGAAYYTGYFQSTSILFSGFILSNASTINSGDIFIARLDTMQAVSVFDKIKNTVENISLTPNPFSNEVLISFHVSHPETTVLKIFDLNGKQVYTDENISWVNGENHFTWNASEMNAGIYFLQIESGKNFYIKKLILMK